MNTLRHVGRAAGTGLVLAPLVAVATLTARDLHARPTGHLPLAASSAAPLSPGAPMRVSLPQDRHAYTAIVLWPSEQATPGKRVFRVCADECQLVEVGVARDLPVVLPLVNRVRGGAASVTVEPGGSGDLPLARWGTNPAVEAVQGWSWWLPVRKARAFAAALAGADVLPILLALDVAAVAATFAFAVWAAIRSAPRVGSSDDEPGEVEHG